MAKPNSNEISINDVSLLAVQASKGAIPEVPQKAYAIRSKAASTDKGTNNDRLKQLMTYLLAIGDQDFTGYIKINYTQGSIGRVERFEEILRKRAGRENP